MAAVTGIINPLNPKETLLFYCSDDQQVGLSPREEDADEPGNSPDFREPEHGSDPVENTPSIGVPLSGTPPATDAPNGVIKNPSSFCSIVYNNLICVYGIRTDGRLCIVSPAFQPLKPGPTLKFNCLAACGDGRKSGWIYYLANDPPVIKELHLSVGGSVVPQAEPNDDSYLCAYYDSPKRYCIYQTKKGLSIIEVSSGTGGLIKNTSNAKSKTPMAVINNSGVIYLYYCDTSNNLLRIVQKKGSWQPSALVDGAQQLADWTQLTVTKTKNGKFNMLFYLPQDGENEYLRIMDSANA